MEEGSEAIIRVESKRVLGLGETRFKKGSRVGQYRCHTYTSEFGGAGGCTAGDSHRQTSDQNEKGETEGKTPKEQGRVRSRRFRPAAHQQKRSICPISLSWEPLASTSSLQKEASLGQEPSSSSLNSSSSSSEQVSPSVMLLHPWPSSSFGGASCVYRIFDRGSSFSSQPQPNPVRYQTAKRKRKGSTPYQTKRTTLIAEGINKIISKLQEKTKSRSTTVRRYLWVQRFQRVLAQASGHGGKRSAQLSVWRRGVVVGRWDLRQPQLHC